MTTPVAQQVEIANNLGTNLYVHMSFYGGGTSDSVLVPGARAGTYSGTPTAKRVQCIGLHGQFSGSPYATCIDRDAVLSLTVRPDGIERS